MTFEILRQRLNENDCMLIIKLFHFLSEFELSKIMGPKIIWLIDNGFLRKKGASNDKILHKILTKKVLLSSILSPNDYSPVYSIDLSLSYV